MRIEIDAGVDLVAMLAHPGQRRRIDDVPRSLQPPGDQLITPAAMPAAMHQNECRHEFLSPFFVNLCICHLPAAANPGKVKPETNPGENA
jgi:hypothetical protein